MVWSGVAMQGGGEGCTVSRRSHGRKESWGAGCVGKAKVNTKKILKPGGSSQGCRWVEGRGRKNKGL